MTSLVLASRWRRLTQLQTVPVCHLRHIQPSVSFASSRCGSVLSALASSATARCRCGSRSAALYTSRPAGHVCVLDFVQRPSRNHERRWASTAQAAQPPASSSAAAGAGPLHSSSSTDKTSATDAGAVSTPPKSRPNLAAIIAKMEALKTHPQRQGSSKPLVHNAVTAAVGSSSSSSSYSLQQVNGLHHSGKVTPSASLSPSWSLSPPSSHSRAGKSARPAFAAVLDAVFAPKPNGAAGGSIPGAGTGTVTAEDAAAQTGTLPSSPHADINKLLEPMSRRVTAQVEAEQQYGGASKRLARSSLSLMSRLPPVSQASAHAPASTDPQAGAAMPRPAGSQGLVGPAASAAPAKQGSQVQHDAVGLLLRQALARKIAHDVWLRSKTEQDDTHVDPVSEAVLGTDLLAAAKQAHQSQQQKAVAAQQARDVAQSKEQVDTKPAEVFDMPMLEELQQSAAASTQPISSSAIPETVHVVTSRADLLNDTRRIRDDTPVVRVDQYITVREFAQQARIALEDVQRAINHSTVGFEYVDANQGLSAEQAGLLGMELNVDVQTALAPDQSIDSSEAKMGTRCPVVCVMGHVDHGKTTLLDALRNSNMVKREFGGITQSLGAFEVRTAGIPGISSDSSPNMTFLDTPGHSAFKNMRQRGATLTDVIVLVVAADDGVMPQTLEVIRLARETETPLVVAINKIDADGADPSRVIRQLAEHGVNSDTEGGNDLFVEISALKRTNLTGLIEAVHLMSSMLDLNVPLDGRAKAVLVESRVDRSRGALLNAIVTQGTLRVGDCIVCGTEYGKVRDLINSDGESLTEVQPGHPVGIIGLKGIEGVGDFVMVAESEDKAREIAEYRLSQVALGQSYDIQKDAMLSIPEAPLMKAPVSKQERIYVLKQKRRAEIEVQRAARLNKITEEGQAAAAVDTNRSVYVIFKADVKGSLEAMIEYTQLLVHPEVKLHVLSAGVGALTTTDVSMAKTCSAHVLAFNVKPTDAIRDLAKQQQVPLQDFRIIYQVFDYIRDRLSEKMPLQRQDIVAGSAEILAIFDLKAKTQKRVLGLKVHVGKLDKKRKYKIVRDRRVLLSDLAVVSLKIIKEDVETVSKGQECGLLLDLPVDLPDDTLMPRAGDTVECYDSELAHPVFDDGAARGYFTVSVKDGGKGSTYAQYDPSARTASYT